MNKSLRVLNVKSDELTGQALVSITRAAVAGGAVEELRMDNQVQLRAGMGQGGQEMRREGYVLIFRAKK